MACVVSAINCGGPALLALQDGVYAGADMRFLLRELQLLRAQTGLTIDFHNVFAVPDESVFGTC